MWRSACSKNSVSLTLRSSVSPRAPTATPGENASSCRAARFSLDPRDPVLYFLQRLRDEAHRFAIGTHRAKRTKALGRSPLDEIGGVGARRKRALLHHFGSARAVARAGLGELERVAGISKTVAKKVHDHFHGDG